ncbi:MAG: hypothetical protein V2J24_19340, partial [Pseudomonadales bacterium]|nr:hypothetical protein [Pseudomonadales bacterium]
MRIRSAHENSFVLLAVLALALPTAAAARSAGTGQVLHGPLIAAASVRPELRSEALEFPSLQPLTGLSDPSIAYGLEGIVDWSSGMQFIDIMRMARPWNLEGRYDADGSVPDAYLDEHGWVTRMPPGTSILHRLWSWEGDDPGLAESRAGRYVVRYEGSGSLALGGADVVSQSPGEIIFDTSGTGVVSLFLKSIEPDDPIRDISVVREDLVPLHDAGEIFNPDWIALIEDARQVRYMDFMHTNNSGIRSWDEYPQFGDSHWG